MSHGNHVREDVLRFISRPKIAPPNERGFTEIQRTAARALSTRIEEIKERASGCAAMLHHAVGEVEAKLQRVATAHREYSDDEDLLDEAIDLQNSSKLSRAIEDIEAVRDSTLEIIKEIRGAISEAV
jgi:hypothetical protein